MAPLLAVVELGRALLSPGPVDHGHVWFVVIAGAVGLFVRMLFTAASSAIGHVLDGHVQLTFRRHLAERLGRVPLGWFSRRRTGELAKVVGETGRTVALVAHRMRTVQRADRVAFLDGGRIVEEGSHDELLRRGGRYAEFWQIAQVA